MTVTERMSGLTKKFSAFTLVELIVVITILAILATVGFLALSGYTQDAKSASIKANVRSIYSAIAAESALTGNSPRFYVVHDAGAALPDGAMAYVDGFGTTLTGGDWNVSGTNYSAGNPDWAKLRLNPEKFRLSASGLPGRGFRALAGTAGFGTAEAAYDSSLVSVGALDSALASTANGRNRSASFFQVAGTAPATKTVTVSGNFPSPTAAQSAAGASEGLVKAPTGTGALVDGEASGGNAPQSNSAAQNLARAACETQIVTVGSASIQIAACNVGASVAGTGSSSWGYYFQFGNLYGFSNPPSTFSAAPYPNSSCTGNDCLTQTFSTGSSWLLTRNDAIWGADCPNSATPTADCELRSKGSCPSEFHIPTMAEWGALAGSTGLNVGSSGNMRDSVALLPYAGQITKLGAYNNPNPAGLYWSSTANGGDNWQLSSFSGFNCVSLMCSNVRSTAQSVRCFKNRY